MRRSVTFMGAFVLVVLLVNGTPLWADSTFTIADPPVDCEVVDADPFDGYGDNGPFSTFNDALLGTLGECRSMAEFDISGFTVPPGESISAATLEVRITATEIYGLGVNGETPESLAVDGYVGNGLEELSDFEVADGNLLDSVATPDPQVGQVLTFDVTAFVTALVNAQEQYVGLTVRAETFGGLWVTEGGGYPKLTIQTVAAGVLGDLNCDGDVDGFDIQPFVLALTDPEGYELAYPDCDIMNADCNGDGEVDGFDIQPFVELLTG